MDIILIGSGGHAKVVIDIVQRAGKHRIVGLIDDFRAAGETTLGIPVLGKLDDLPSLLTKNNAGHGLIAIGDNGGRMRVAERIASLVPSFTYVSALHPSSNIGTGVIIGAGSVLMAGTTVNASSVLGAHCVINTNSSVDHDCVLGDFSSLAPGANLGGACRVGTGSAIGINASMVQKAMVGAHCVIGAGAAVIENVPDLNVAMGVPARCVRTRTIGEPYL